MENKIVLDYKTRLQEILQKNGDVSIDYVLISYDGPPHRRKFYTEVCMDKNVLGKGMGYSKKESEQNAAHNALNKLDFKTSGRV